jgi:hypothetical protein
MIVKDGFAAIKRIPARGKLIRVNGTEYLFRIQHNISMCWVKEEDAPSVLAIRERGCCGGGMHSVFQEALEHDVRRWTVGGR